MTPAATQSSELVAGSGPERAASNAGRRGAAAASPRAMASRPGPMPPPRKRPPASTASTVSAVPHCTTTAGPKLVNAASAASQRSVPSVVGSAYATARGHARSRPATSRRTPKRSCSTPATASSPPPTTVEPTARDGAASAATAASTAPGSLAGARQRWAGSPCSITSSVVLPRSIVNSTAATRPASLLRDDERLALHATVVEVLDHELARAVLVLPPAHRVDAGPALHLLAVDAEDHVAGLETDLLQARRQLVELDTLVVADAGAVRLHRHLVVEHPFRVVADVVVIQATDVHLTG